MLEISFNFNLSMTLFIIAIWLFIGVIVTVSSYVWKSKVYSISISKNSKFNWGMAFSIILSVILWPLSGFETLKARAKLAATNDNAKARGSHSPE